MRDASQKIARKRLAFLCLVLVVWAGAIVARLVQLQVVQHEMFANYARSQQTRKINLLGPRGMIVDRTGNPLAVSLEHESIAINPMRVPDARVAAKALARTFGFSPEVIEKKILRYQENRWGFLWIRRWASPEELEAARALGVDWMEYYKESKRHYPKQELASHVLGSVGVDGSGLFGLEQSMHYLLQGEDGDETVLQDVKRRPIQSEITKQPKAGISLRITLDQRIQSAAESALRNAIAEHKVPSGTVVVMDPNNGDILAMANYPDFNPNERPRTLKELEHRFNRAISLEYEPGSVFKVVPMAAGLERTRYTPDSIINCGNGIMRLPGRTIHDHRSYSMLSFAHVLAKSSNIGAINVAFAVGKDLMYDYVRAFGFGTKTGLPLPYEQSGYVWPMHKQSSQKVYGSILASVAMGHQISATSVQLAQACSVIANGGTLVKPRLLMEMQSPDGAITPVNPKKGDRVLQPETAITMRRLMEGVMLEGTGKAGRLSGWTSGGKTGTAQMFDLKQKRYLKLYHSSFIGFAPLQNPAIVVVVTLNESKLYGGTVAAPVFREVASETLRILGVPMDNPGTVLAKNEKPALADVQEGDGGLHELAGTKWDAKLLPDTRKQLLTMLSAAVKEDPEMEDWMFGDPRYSLPSLRGEQPNAPSQARSTNAPAQLAENSFPQRNHVESEAARAQREFEQSSTYTTAAADFTESGTTTVTAIQPLATPDFRGKSMRDVMAEAMETGLEVHVFGRGMARQQIPPPGTRIPRGIPVRVLFAP